MTHIWTSYFIHVYFCVGIHVAVYILVMFRLLKSKC